MSEDNRTSTLQKRVDEINRKVKDEGNGNGKSGLSWSDLPWIAPLLLIGIIGWYWRLSGIVVFAIFLVLLLVVIFFMAKEKIWFTSVPQNAAVGIMWGSGNAARLHRLAVVLGSDIFYLDAAGKRHEAYWFEKKFNIWWMGPLGSVYKFTTFEVEEIREETEAGGEENVIERRKVVKTTHDHINIDKEETLLLLIPPIPCSENFDVLINISTFYIILTARDALKALFNVTNLSKAMSNKIEAAIKIKVGSKTFDELRQDAESIEKEAWDKLDKDHQLKHIKEKWGVQINHLAVRDTTAEPEAAKKLKSVAFAEKDAEALVIKGKGESDYDTLRGKGEKSRTTAQYEGYADGYAKVAAIADGAGIRMEQLRTLQIMPNAKIISMPDFTGALSDVTGKSSRTLAADLIAAGFTLEQLQQEFVKAKKAEKEVIGDNEEEDEQK